MGTIADILGFGNAAGPHYQLDYSTATGAGITSATQATLASSNGIANICYLNDAATMVMLRSDVDVDVIASNGYPRSEWREKATNGTTDRAFTPTTGDHMAEVMVLPTHLPPVKPSFVVCQMHDQNDDIIEIALQPNAALGVLEVVGRVNGSSRVQIGVDGGGQPIYYTWPKLIADFQWGTWLYCWIRVGAIHSGATGYEFSCNGVTVKDTDNVNMPAMAASGANSYFKSGMYLQTKWTGSGTNGLETDRNEYGEAGWKTFKTYHNGESAPFQPTSGTDVTATPTVVTPRFGAQAKASGTGTGISITPAFPTAGSAPVEGELVFAVVRAYRSSASSVVATPTCTTTGWARATPNWPISGAVYADVGLIAHTLRYQFWVAEFTSGLSAPTFTTAGGSDTLHGIIGAVANSQIGISCIQQAGDVGIAATSTTTTLGPAPALAASVPIGSLILAFLDHEY